MPSILKNNVLQVVFGSGFARAYVLLVELILVVVSAALLQPGDRGVYIAGIGLLKTMAVLATFSVGQVCVHRIASAKDTAAQLGTEFGTLVASGCLFSFTAYGIFFVTGFLSPTFHSTYVAPFSTLVLVGLPVYLFEIYFYTLLISTGLVKAANRSIVIGKTITWILVVLNGYVFAPITAADLVRYVIFGQLLVLLGYFAPLRSLLKQKAVALHFSLREIVITLKSAVRLYPTIVGSVVFGGIDLLLIYNYAGAAGTSTYQIALQGIAALSVLPFAVAQFGYGVVTAHGPGAGWQKYRKVLFMSFAVHLLMAAVSVPVAALADDLLLHGRYPDLFGVYILMAIGSPGVFLSLTLAPMWIGHGRFLVSSVLSVATAAIVIPMNLILLQNYGLRGGAVAFLAAQLLSLATNGYMIYYCEKNDKAR